MTHRPTARLAALVCAAAGLSSGCAFDRMIWAIPPPAESPDRSTLVGARTAGKSAAQIPDNPVPAARGSTPNPILHVVAEEPSLPLPPPQRLTPPTGPAPQPMPQSMPMAIDPHTRGTPTAAGAALGLQPWESPLDKAVELARKIDACSADNKVLLARIRALEAAAEQRQQAVTESVREVETATEQVIRTRADVQTLRQEIVSLRGKITRMEKEEAETLQAVIAALERLIAQQEGGQ